MSAGSTCGSYSAVHGERFCVAFSTSQLIRLLLILIYVSDYSFFTSVIIRHYYLTKLLRLVWKSSTFIRPTKNLVILVGLKILLFHIIVSKNKIKSYNISCIVIKKCVQLNLIEWWNCWFASARPTTCAFPLYVRVHFNTNDVDPRFNILYYKITVA